MFLGFTWESFPHLLSYSVSLQHDLLYTRGATGSQFSFLQGPPSVAKKKISSASTPTHTYTSFAFKLHCTLFYTF